MVSMVDLAQSTFAVAGAMLHYRQACQLTLDELSYVLSTLGHEVESDDLCGMERGLAIITVDDLVALAVAFDVTPVDLLTFVPADYPGSGRLGTGVPSDADQPEIRAWMQGTTALDHESRVRWAQERVDRLEILTIHCEDQYRGARAELDDLGELALQEADMPPVIRLHDRIREGEQSLVQATNALAYAELRLGQLMDEDVE